MREMAELPRSRQASLHGHYNLDSQFCVWCGHNGWLLRTERFLSASCMGWCLQASFKEHPKSTTIAYAGGASGLYLANFFLTRLANRPANRRLLHAGGLFSVVGVAWTLNLAFDEHPKATIKACLAGALSICLTKSVIFGDPLAFFEETPKEEIITRNVANAYDMNNNYAPDPFDMNNNYAPDPFDMNNNYEPDPFDNNYASDPFDMNNNTPLPVQQTKHVLHVGQGLTDIARDFGRRKSER